jgi:hypothetical protein
LSEINDADRDMQELVVASRRIVSIVSSYFDDLTAAGFTRAEGLSLTRDYQRHILTGGGSGGEDD